MLPLSFSPSCSDRSYFTNSVLKILTKTKTRKRTVFTCDLIHEGLHNNDSNEGSGTVVSHDSMVKMALS